MKAYLTEFMNSYAYPLEGAETLLEAYDRIRGENKEAFDGLIATYAGNRNCDFGKLIQGMADVSQTAGIHPYTGDLLLMMCLSRSLKEFYRRQGIDEDIWFTSMGDLKYKMMECHVIKGIWGTFVAKWFDRFFNLTRFGFGKLQFETVSVNRHFSMDGLVLQPTDEVINVHIPRTGGRLDRESKEASYRQAAAFYKKTFGDGPIIFVCHSWLLSPRHKEMLPASSNLRGFAEDYILVDQGDYEDYSQVWRLFDREYKGNVDELPQDTSLRRIYADWIRKGEKTSWGLGVYVWRR